jgi:DNA-directed RNA polymerase specialized sigma subunit
MKTKEEYVLFLLKNYKAINDEKKESGSSFVPINGMVRDLQYIDQALDALDNYSTRIIKDIYFDGMSWLDAAEKNYVSHSTISRARKKALRTIINYFEGRLM